MTDKHNSILMSVILELRQLRFNVICNLAQNNAYKYQHLQ